MANANPNRILIAGTGSGCGKTTVTCALLGALKSRGIAVSSFKVGPDYIDPMFHSEILGTKSRNLDLFLMSKRGVLSSLADNTAETDIAVIEGVMGFYDGVGKTAEYSTCHLANTANVPVILVVNAKGMSLSVCAFIKGYLSFSDNRIQGVIFNGVSSEQMYEMYRDMVKTHTGLKSYGYLPKMPEVSLESRHLGLVTAAEVGNLKEMIALLSAQAEKTLDIDGLLELSKTAISFSYEPFDIKKIADVRIAVARDRAFCFYYEDSLNLLSRCGAKLLPFSPLQDACIPKEADGVLFGGGYPELYLKALSQNLPMLESVRSAYRSGMPIVGECGGFLYLHKAFVAEDGSKYPLAGCIDAEAHLTKRLQRFGYVNLTAQSDNVLCKKGEQIPAHEFHYADSTDNGSGFFAKKCSTSASYPCIVTAGSLFAGYPHLHFYGNPAFAAGFVKACAKYRRRPV